MTDDRPPDSRASALDLSPSAAAATLSSEPPEAAGERTCRGAFQASSADCDRPSATDPGQRLQQSLADDAARIPHLAPRPPPELRHDSNGDYHYEGPAFTATIRRDGSVSITDREPVQVGPIPIGGVFDISDMVEKYILDKPLYAAEKRWFLEETAALRHSLVEAERSRSLAQGRLHLRGRLESILADEGLPATRKRALVFELWDDCAPDGTGAEAQRLIEAFIRDRMPPGSALAYPALELAEWNRLRASRRPFDPYRAADGGGPG